MKRTKSKRAAEQASAEAKRELSDYFMHEDFGPRSVTLEPRGGTQSRDPVAPEFPPGADPEMMALVYRRLQLAQGWVSKNIFALLRSRYSHGEDPRDKVVVRPPENMVDHAEMLYGEARKMMPEMSRDEREWARVLRQDAATFRDEGARYERWVGDDED